MRRCAEYLFALTILATTAARADVPRALGYQGRLLKADGSGETGIVGITYAVYDAPEGGRKLWSETQQVGLTDGFYATFLGDAVPFPADLFDGGERFLQVTVGAEDLSPRQRIGSVAFALKAAVADRVAGGAVDAASISVGGHPVIDADGHLTGAARYRAGSGVEIDSSSNTIALLSGCAAGQVLSFDGSGWICGAAGATYVAGRGLELTAGAFSLKTGCATGEILRWNGQDWACSAAGTVASVAVSAPLAVTNGTTTPTISLPPATASAAGYLTAADWAKFDAKLADGAIAGGDLAGTLPSPNVAKLQGKPLSPAAPAAGDVLKWDGTSWSPAADDANAGTVTGISIAAGSPLTIANANTTPVIAMTRASATSAGYLAAADFSAFSAKIGASDPAGGDVSGSFGSLKVASLRGAPLSATTPSSAGQVLAWDGTAWAPTTLTDSNSGGTVTNVAALAPLGVANGSTTPVITIARASASAGGYLDSADFAVFSAKVGPTSAAGGDVSGTFAALTVGALQGVPVSATAPTTVGDALLWNGTAWAPGAIVDTNSGGTVTNVTGSGPLSVANGSSTPAISIAKASASADGYLASSDFSLFAGKIGPASAAGGDVTGTFGSLTVASIQGMPVSPTATATTGDALVWNGSEWAPGAIVDTNSGGTVTNVTSSGPLSVANGSSTPAISIAKASASADGYLASSDFSLFAAKLGSASRAGGDVTGTFGSLTVASIQGMPISATATAATGDALVWNGSEWAPGAIVDTNSGGTVTNVTGSGPLSVANGSSTPAISIARASASADGFLAATDFASFAGKIGSGSAASGDLAGTFPAPSVAKLQGVPVSATAPSTVGQVLKWNGSAWAPGADVDTNAGGTVTNVTGAGPLSVANGSSTPAISIAKASASADGYLASSDFSLFAGKIGPASRAGGDVSGTFGALTVASLQGVPVSSSAPTTVGHALLWNGSEWAPGAIVDTNSGGTVTNVTASGPLSVSNGTSTPAIAIARASASADGYLAATDFAAFAAKIGSGSAASGDLSGTFPAPSVAKLQGVPVSSTAPTTAGQVLKWNGTAWAPGTDVDTNAGGTVTSVSVSSPLTISNATTTPSISLAQASSVSAGYLSAADWSTFSGKLAPTSSAAGDLSGTYASPTVAKLQGYAVAATAPSSGQVLAWNGSAWAPALPSGFTPTFPDATGATPAAFVVSSTIVPSTSGTVRVSLQGDGTATLVKNGTDTTARIAAFNASDTLAIRLRASSLYGGLVSATAFWAEHTSTFVVETGANTGPTWAASPADGATIATIPQWQTMTPVQLSASDPDGVSFSLVGGNLPSGVTMSSAGQISGAPTVSGTFNITVRASDGFSPAATTDRSFVINVTAASGTVSCSGSGLLVGPNKCIFHYTGSAYTLTVTGTLPVTIKAWGAGGGGGSPGRTEPSRGGGGGFATGTLVMSGGTYQVLVGGGGKGTTGVGGTYGGGTGGNGNGGGGGGRSAIVSGGNDLFTAGAGGGGGYDYAGAPGGGLTGGRNAGDGGGGLGGTQTAGGAGGTGGTLGTPGTKGQGGNSTYAGGGGGGGYYGGGGSGTQSGYGNGGGGGSSYLGSATAASTASGSTTVPGGNTDAAYESGIAVGGAQGADGGNGLVVVSW